ncbi:MAG: tRNA-dihydrouridine synthase family protein [Bacteroidales bacterium]|nr:tRNA-dihydrouridine synthase family protein [Bacteroidales bacterium]
MVLSPMDGVTDLPFRELCKKHGADLLVTEFIASDALIRDAEKSMRKMLFTEAQRPIGIQVFGNSEDSLLQCVDVVAEARPDFIDINWGCPVRKVAGRGAGAGMLQDIPKLLKITAAIVKRSPLPVTVKTRLGYQDDDKPIVSLAEQLQDVGITAIAIHGRTKTQMYQGQADWSLIGAVKRNPRMRIPIYGNGDLRSPDDVLRAKQLYGVDGVLIGRAAIGMPWIFEQARRALEGLPHRDISVAERCETCREHLLASVAFKGEHAALFEMRKHYGGYFWGLPHFRGFRQQLVTADTVEGLLTLFSQIAEQYPSSH